MKKYNVTVNGTAYEVCIEEVEDNGATPVAAKAQPATTAVNDKTVTAPMPGTILDVKVSVGSTVKKGDVVCVLEAMKMENDIPATADGVVASVNVQKGSTVASGAVIVTLK